MNKPVLSICIPTFNREEYLRRLLDSLLPQVEATQGMVSVVVTDNASTDGTGEMCRPYAESGALSYFRNNENMGGEYNVIRAFELGSADYVWVLGDDEVVYPGALVNILEVFAKFPRAGLIYLRPDAYSPNKKNGLIGRLVGLKWRKFFPWKLLDSKKAINKIGINTTFISAIIIKREAVSVDSSFFSGKYSGSNIPQLAWVLPAIAFFPTVYFNFPQIGAQQNNSGGYRIFDVFGINFCGIVRGTNFLDGKSIRALVRSSMFCLSIRYFRPKDKYEKDNYILVMDRLFGLDFLYRFLFRPVLFGPLGVFVDRHISGGANGFIPRVTGVLLFWLKKVLRAVLP